MIDGLLVVDKPPGMTSHDVVGRCRRVFGQRRVGHAGTLDPDATGLLLVGLGRATRLLQFLTGLPKTYEGEVVLGVATSTLDAAGEETGRWDMSAVTLDDARAAAAELTGDIEQVPPMVSAVKVGGRRLHQLAREGVEVDRPSRAVTVTRFDVSPTAEPTVLAVVVGCSSGTYVRSLAADLGTRLGGGAHLRGLRRTAVGPWTLDDAVPLDAASPADVRSPASALHGMAAVRVAPDVAAAVAHGGVLERALLDGSHSDEAHADEPGPGPWALLDHDGNLLAVYEAYRDDRAKPVAVLAG